MAPSRKKSKRRLTLALQGGGAHGAFTWGVLDRLLEEDDIEVEGVSATSAGAMNGAMYTTGLKIGGPEEAKRRLADFWGQIRDAYPLNQLPWSIWAKAFHDFLPPALNPAAAIGGAVSQVVSPYQLPLADINPLRDVLESMVSFDKVCRRDEPRLFVCATDVLSGRAKIFMGEEISVDALLASACLPTIYRAVEIDGREYWDGGYTGNPALWPLIYECDTSDVLIVHINPITRRTPPRDARGIQNRINEISFNSNLLGELRAIETVDKLVAAGHLPAERYKRMRIHAVEDPETMRSLSASTKVTPEARLLDRLYDAGRNAMTRWLDEHKAKIGIESSINLRDAYL
ncbi:MAG: patatin-like phospholipase family protein [Neomegalonema sp.]|nr:patatin-like phospholipase family protein [Neomegalonema sp.]